MTNSDENGSQPNIDEIDAAIEANASEVPEANAVDGLRDRLDRVELLIEEFGRAVELQDQVSEYVSDLQEELADLRLYRFWTTIITVTMSCLLFAVLIGCVWVRPDWFLALEGKVQVSLIAALGAGAVFLMSILLRGAYRSRSDRNSDEMLPESLRAVLEATRSS